MYVDKCKLCINMIFVQIENLNYVDRNEVQCLVKEKHHEVLITHITPSKGVQKYSMALLCLI